MPSINPSDRAEAIRLALPYPPSLNRIWRSARVKLKGGGLGRPFVYPSKEYKAWVAEAHISWLQQRLQLPTRSIQGEYSITILAHPPDQRHRDLGNLEKVVSDFLQTVGVIENDSLAGDIRATWDKIDTPINSIRVELKPYAKT